MHGSGAEGSHASAAGNAASYAAVMARQRSWSESPELPQANDTMTHPAIIDARSMGSPRATRLMRKLGVRCARVLEGGEWDDAEQGQSHEVGTHRLFTHSIPECHQPSVSKHLDPVPEHPHQKDPPQPSGMAPHVIPLQAGDAGVHQFNVTLELAGLFVTE